MRAFCCVRFISLQEAATGVEFRRLKRNSRYLSAEHERSVRLRSAVSFLLKNVRIKYAEDGSQFRRWKYFL